MTKLMSRTEKISGETAVIPSTGKIICRTTIRSYKEFVNGPYQDDYHPQHLKQVYNAITGNEMTNDISILILGGHIYLFPESKNIGDDLNTFLIAKDLFGWGAIIYILYIKPKTP